MFRPAPPTKLPRCFLKGLAVALASLSSESRGVAEGIEGVVNGFVVELGSMEGAKSLVSQSVFTLEDVPGETGDLRDAATEEGSKECWRLSCDVLAGFVS